VEVLANDEKVRDDDELHEKIKSWIQTVEENKTETLFDGLENAMTTIRSLHDENLLEDGFEKNSESFEAACKQVWRHFNSVQLGKVHFLHRFFC